ncbi:MAG TPA: AsmA family protein [Candidatus Binataceae bacterium]|nr:AsmA family protein [Candidatus Binataceae bacterium]
MRKAITIVFILLGLVFIGVFGVLLYAYFNLNSIIADNQGRVLAAVSNALGRDVQAGAIKASLGWGVSAEVSDLKVADDPAISQQPFIQADTVSAKLNLMPLLSRHLDITEVVLEKPVINVIQASDGQLNVSTIGKKHEEHVAPPQPTGAEQGGAAGGTPLEGAGGEKKPGALPSLYVKNFTVEDGQLVFEQQATGTKLTVNSIELHVRNFAFDQAFEVDLAMAALGDKSNVNVSANVGPVMQAGALNVDAIPLSAKVSVGPIDFDSLKSIAMLAKSIPPKLTIAQPLSVDATADGTVAAIKFTATTDLTANQISFGDTFSKPASLPLKVSADGTRNGAKIEIALAEVTLGDIDLKATDIRLAPMSARVDTDSFDLAPLGKLVPPIAKYDLSGKTEVHVNAALVGGKPSANGTVVLTSVALAIPDQKAPPLGGLSGTIKLAGNTAEVGPLTFNLGQSHGTLSSHVESIQPVRLTYQLNADAIHLADLVPSRPPDEQINQLASNGSVAMSDAGPAVNAHVTSASGNLAKVAYQSLALDGSLAGKSARVTSLRVNAFSGSIAATADTQLAAKAPFNTAINFSRIDVQQALQSQDSKAAGMVRGSVTGNITVSGVAGTFDQMKPTFRGNGRVALANGKLVGVNVAADALKKVQNLPGIGNLISPAIIAKHPELFSNPDTDIQSASLSFVLQGPRLTSHDIVIKNVDYGMTGDGWFDMDKNIDLAAIITLSRPFTQELVGERQNIVYVTNNNGEVSIPLQVVGQLPKPRVLPDVQQLVQQAGSRAVEAQGQKAINKFLGKKGLGGLLGGGDNGGGGGGGNNNPPPNPLDQLKKFF